MKKIIVAICLLTYNSTHAQPTAIIPKPVQIIQPKVPGNFIIKDRIVIDVQGTGHENSYFFLSAYLKQYYNITTIVWMDTPSVKNAIHLNYERLDNPIPGAYNLEVKKDGIHINGDNETGVFYGIQTLIQLLPTEKDKPLAVPFVKINDYPRFAYRGLHLDVGRHFMPVAFIKKYIDYIALHKLNYFHWHLTEDQGWRIEIKKYPRLTSVASMRNGTIIGRYPGKGSDNTPHGGFYTQEQIKDIVDYASKRYITIVPEIELPGHSSAAIAAYPWLSCFPEEKTKIPANMISDASTQRQAQGEKKLVQETWGVFPDVFCAGNDSTFQFLQDVMDEVLQLFPGKYIHIGGDECPKSNWKRCPRCQQRIKQEGLKDEHQLQSYFVQRMEGYLNKRGRSMIGWDEILEGGLAPNAIVMSWRGEAGGIAAAKQKHEVIMTPGNFMYFDHSQSKKEDSITIGSYTPIEEVYSYEPATKELTSQQAKYIIGAQANIWTEYMGYPSKVEYMLFPRISALSEVLWSQKVNKNWKDFEGRLKKQFKRYDLWAIKYSSAYFSLTDSVFTKGEKIYWSLKTNSSTRIRAALDFDVNKTSSYSNDAIIPFYTKPINIYTNSIGVAVLLDSSNRVISKISKPFSLNKATGKKTTLANPPAQNFPGEGGPFGLVNGVISDQGYTSTEWLGWQGKDMEAVIDLGKPIKISSITAHILTARGSQPCKPQWMETSFSTTGTAYKTLGQTSDIINDSLNMGRFVLNVNPTTTRFIKVKVKNFGKIPDGMPGAGNEAWLYVDEIQVE
jgi:hexosaminidase